MKKPIYILCVLSLLIASCSSNSNEESTTDTSSILPKKITYIENGTTETNTIAYNGNKIVSMTSSGGTSTIYTYTGNQITQIDSYTGTHLDDRETYAYNSNGKLATYVSLNYNSTNTATAGEKQVFVYNADGTVSYVVYYGNLVTQTTVNYTGTVFITNGEITKVDYVYSGSSTHYVRNYIYDDKNNPFKNITGYAETSFTINSPNGYTHNIISDENVSNPNFSIANTYTYNSNNFPTEAVEHSSGSTYTTQYVY